MIKIKRAIITALMVLCSLIFVGCGRVNGNELKEEQAEIAEIDENDKMIDMRCESANKDLGYSNALTEKYAYNSQHMVNKNEIESLGNKGDESDMSDSGSGKVYNMTEEEITDRNVTKHNRNKKNVALEGILNDDFLVQSDETERARDIVDTSELEPIDDNFIKKIYFPGEDMSVDDGMIFAMNEPSKNGENINTMGVLGVKGDKVIIDINRYVDCGVAEEAPDGSKNWSGTNDGYSADIQVDVNGDIYVAYFTGENELAWEYIQACASAISHEARDLLRQVDGTGTFCVGSMLFDVEQRANGYSMKVCSNYYANTLEPPY